MKKSPILVSSALAALAMFATGAMAETPPPQGVVSLTSSASIDVTKDLLSVVFGATREASDAAAVQTQLKQALDAALAEARRVAKPGQVDVQTGNFSLYPRYDKNGRISTWQGSAELLVEGRDIGAIGALAGRITTMAITRVGQGLSRELREKVEGEVAAQAIARFRAKAADYAKQFGYAGYTIREVNVSSADVPPPMPMLRAKAMAAAADESLPVEADKGTVTISVGGTVQLTR